ncbi:extra-cytoplasmic solute receptor [Ramlibacter sp. G-1-2-2]|uniref:Extra-cytoplasmic solute receptor n=1 Tax=Ramlibacter agri TaxID=2728837 RepID=A0A848GZ32_9BURK|nr:tripartite tricarboxylate transporter substrate-binding protein [Ramlibacter agri]NML43584.1 extra-cytoplasmic solute receptor [Ramlibacter agri]
MSVISRRTLLQAAAFGAAVPRFALAQEPLKLATMVVGSPAGGTTDKLARMYAEGLQQHYAKTVVVDNRPGAGGVIAYDYVKRSGVKDGSLFFISPAYPIVITPHLVSNLPYDPLRDFVPVATTGRSGMTFAVGPGTPASVKTLADYLAWVKANPKQGLYAAQTGSSQHLMGAIMAQATGVALENVSYKGDAPALQDTLGGHVPAVVLPIAAALPLHKQGRIRVLAVARSTRSRYLPEVPTFTELGYKDVLFQDWLGMFAPADTAPARVRELSQLVGEIQRSPQGTEALQLMGMEPDVMAPEAFAEALKADWQRYGAFVQRTNFREIYEKASGR